MTELLVAAGVILGGGGLVYGLVRLGVALGGSKERNRRIQEDVEAAIEADERRARPLPTDEHMDRLGMPDP